MPAKNIVEDLKAEEGNTKKLLENVKYRVGWEKYQRAQKEKEDAEVGCQHRCLSFPFLFKKWPQLTFRS